MPSHRTTRNQAAQPARDPQQAPNKRQHRPEAVRDAREQGWFWADNSLIDTYGPEIGAYGIAVYCALARYADQQGRAFPSLGRLAEQLHTSKPTIRNAIDKLVEHGLISVASRRDSQGDATSHEYVLKPIASHRHKHDGGSKGDLPPLPGGGKGDLPQVVKDVYQGGKGRLHEQDSWNKTHMEQSPPPSSTQSAPMPGGGGDLFHQLIAEPYALSSKVAREIVESGADGPTICRSIDNYLAGAIDPDERQKRIGRFVLRFRAGPPEPGQPYRPNARATAARVATAPPAAPENCLAPADAAAFLLANRPQRR